MVMLELANLWICEQEEDRLLFEYQHMRDMEKLVAEQEKILAKRHENQKMAAYNLGASEAQKNKKNEKGQLFIN